MSCCHAVGLLRGRLGAGDPTRPAPACGARLPIARKASEAEALDDAALGRRGRHPTCETLQAGPEPIAYLESRGLNDVALIEPLPA